MPQSRPAVNSPIGMGRHGISHGGGSSANTPPPASMMPQLRENSTTQTHMPLTNQHNEALCQTQTNFCTHHLQVTNEVVLDRHTESYIHLQGSGLLPHYQTLLCQQFALSLFFFSNQCWSASPMAPDVTHLPRPQPASMKRNLWKSDILVIVITIKEHK